MEFTTVCGVDSKHFTQLKYSYLSWAKHKPDIFANPMVIFYDCQDEQLNPHDIKRAIPHKQLLIVPWPTHNDAQYPKTREDKFGDAQRYKMLAGFVYVPAAFVDTEYWLKLDTDTVATGCPNWVDNDWFRDKPNIIAQAWGFTKPANQMITLDNWAGINRLLSTSHPLDLIPREGQSRINHPRIISWCGFFRKELSVHAAKLASETVGYGLLPVPSQDGYMWYLAHRRDPDSVVRVDMKSRGWKHQSSLSGIRQAVKESLEEQGTNDE